MNNRSQTTGIYVVFQVVMALVVAGFLFGLVGSVSSTTTLEREFLSKDLSLLVNTLTSAPGNIFFTYLPREISESRFSYSFNVQKSSVSDFVVQSESWMGVPIGGEVEYPYADNLIFFTKPTDFKDPVQLHFLNHGYQLDILEEIDNPDLRSHKFPWVSTRQDDLRAVSFSFFSDTDSKHFVDYLIDGINNKAGKAVASFGVGAAEASQVFKFSIIDDHKDHVFIFFNVGDNALVNRKLSSLITNELQSRNVKTVVIPFVSQEPLNVELEIGRDASKSSQEIKESVFDAIVRYYVK